MALELPERIFFNSRFIGIFHKIFEVFRKSEKILCPCASEKEMGIKMVVA